MSDKIRPNNIRSSCYVMPTFDSIPDENLRIIDNTIQYNEVQSNQKISFNYNKVYGSAQDFAKLSFNTSISPLVKQTIEGESTMVLFTGIHNTQQPQKANTHQTPHHNVQGLNHSVSAHSIIQSLVSQAAGQLINSVISPVDNHKKIGSVTFSWYTVDCHQAATHGADSHSTVESISDILKTASTSANSSSAPVNDTTLMIRELGKGRGIVVPGLWEVEVSSAADVESVIAHVQKMIPHANYNNLAGANNNAYHTVMQLTVTNKAKQHAGSSFNSGATMSSPSKHTTIIADPVGVGRMSFILLSNITATPVTSNLQQSQHQMRPSPVTITPWAESIHNIISWLESKRVSPPFHKSRLLLILKDVLCGRQSTSLMLFVQPTKEQHDLNFEWFRLVSRLAKDSSVSDAVKTGTITPQQQQSSVSTPGAHTALSAASTRHNRLKGTVSSFVDPNAATVDIHTAAHHQSAMSSRKAATTQQSSEQPMSFLEEFNSERQNGKNLHNTLGGSRSTTPSMRRSNSNNDVANLHLLGNHTAQSNKPGQQQSNFNAHKTAPAAHRAVNSQQQHAHGEHKNGNGEGNYNAGSETEYTDDFAHREAEAALTLALEASRNEAAALKIAYNYANDKFSETKQAYDTLLEQLKEEGAMLTKRDRERYRGALKDLKDYEIYKEVMETAMMRLQAELELYAKENQELKGHRLHEEKVSKKQKNFSVQYSKDLCATKKKLTDVEQTLADTQKQLKQMTRERDTAVATLAQVKSVGSQREGQIKVSAELRQAEVEELRRKLQQAEENNKALESERDSVIAVTEKEKAALKVAHQRALETLLGYQEENDAMRTVIKAAGLVEPQSPTPPPPTRQKSHSTLVAGSGSSSREAEPQPKSLKHAKSMPPSAFNQHNQPEKKKQVKIVERAASVADLGKAAGRGRPPLPPPPLPPDSNSEDENEEEDDPVEELDIDELGSEKDGEEDDDVAFVEEPSSN